MKNTHFSRRTILRSVGAATIGLPLLEEMMLSTALAAPKKEVPVRGLQHLLRSRHSLTIAERGFRRSP